MYVKATRFSLFFLSQCLNLNEGGKSGTSTRPKRGFLFAPSKEIKGQILA